MDYRRQNKEKIITFLIPDLNKNYDYKKSSARFNELAQQGKFKEILNELFAPNAKSVEPEGTPFHSVEGLDNIIAKGKQFHDMLEEMHVGYTSEVLVSGDYFTCAMGMDVTMKGLGRQKFDEVAVYHVKGGKIVSEQLFF